MQDKVCRLNYRHGSSPPLRRIDVDTGEDIQVADNFDEFIRGLIPEENFYGPESESP